MKITGTTLMVSFETEVKLGNNDAIELTLQHQAFISRDKLGGMDIDLDLGIDITDVKFLGVGIETGYNAYKEFKDTVLKLGIDLNKLVDEKLKELSESKIEDELKLMFKSRF
jgi:hypothetical protein